MIGHYDSQRIIFRIKSQSCKRSFQGSQRTRWAQWLPRACRKTKGHKFVSKQTQHLFPCFATKENEWISIRRHQILTKQEMPALNPDETYLVFARDFTKAVGSEGL